VSNDYPTDVPASTASRPVLTAGDQVILSGVEQALADGLALKKWWEHLDASGNYSERFDLIRQFNQSDVGFGFYGNCPFRGRDIPVMGVVDEAFFDRAKTIPGERHDEFREFFLHYFLRVSSFRLPEAATEESRRAQDSPLRRLGWCQGRDVRRLGFGYTQLYFKLTATGEVGAFEGSEQYAIVDLREIGPKYEWIVLKVRIFDFEVTVEPLGRSSPRLVFTLDQASYLVLSPEFITNRENPAPGVLAEYGLGYAFMKNPTTEGQIAYGPGNFEVAIQLINFKVLDGGEIMSQLAFVANRPIQLIDLSFDPLNWGLAFADLMSFGLASRILFPDGLPGRSRLAWRTGFDPIFAGITLANWLTAGLAGRQLCISREELEQRFLVQHYMQHYETLVSALLTWRQVPDWRDEAHLPHWVITGFSS
jgi:hypothetical protein